MAGTGYCISRLLLPDPFYLQEKCLLGMEDPRERAYKAVTYAAVTFSVVAIVSLCISMPIVYSFVDSIQHQTKKDLQFCKVGSLLETSAKFHLECLILQ